MAAALLTFWCGRHGYRRVVPEGNPFGATFGVLCAGFCAWARGREPWLTCLDAAVPKYGDTLVADVRQLVACVTLMVPAPIFWSLFDQQSSRWTFQVLHLQLGLGAGLGLCLGSSFGFGFVLG